MGLDAIPGRVIFNNCVLFVAEVRKIVGKKNLTEREMDIMRKAAVIAALSSNHSWKTHKYLNNYTELDKEALALEFDEALRNGWRKINETDVEEVINGEFNKYNLSMWFYYAMPEEVREQYKSIFEKMKKQLAYGLEPMEKQV